MKKQIWSETYKITSFMVNLKGRAGLYTILSLIQDVGWQHAIHLEVKLPKDQGWVFTRQKLVMTEWPKWNETVTVHTWIRPPIKDLFLLRDYELFIDDRKIGEGTSTFTVMDMSTRKIANVDWQNYSSTWRTEGHLSHNPSKLSLSEPAENLAEFQVRNSDIDLNNHVNNTKYAQWILDSIPIEILKGEIKLLGYEVNFLAEVKTGDIISIQKSDEAKEGKTSIIPFQGIRAKDSKPVFTAQLTTESP